MPGPTFLPPNAQPRPAGPATGNALAAPNAAEGLGANANDFLAMIQGIMTGAGLGQQAQQQAPSTSQPKASAPAAQPKPKPKTDDSTTSNASTTTPGLDPELEALLKNLPPLTSPDVRARLESTAEGNQPLSSGLALAAIAINNPELATQLFSQDKAAQTNALNQLTNLAAQEGATKRSAIQQWAIAQRTAAAQESALKRDQQRAEDRRKLQREKAELDRATEDLKQAHQLPTMPARDYDISTPEGRKEFYADYATAREQAALQVRMSDWVKKVGDDAASPGAFRAQAQMTEDQILADPILNQLYRDTKERYDRHKRFQEAQIASREAITRVSRATVEAIPGDLPSMKIADLQARATSQANAVRGLQAQAATIRMNIANLRGQAAIANQSGQTDWASRMEQSAAEQQLILTSLQSTIDLAKDNYAKLNEELARRKGQTTAPGIDPESPMLNPDRMGNTFLGELNKAVDEVFTRPAVQRWLNSQPLDALLNPEGTTDTKVIFLRALLARSQAANLQARAYLHEIVRNALRQLRSTPGLENASFSELYVQLEEAYNELTSNVRSEALMHNVGDTSWWKPGYQRPPWIISPAPSYPSPRLVQPKQPKPPAATTGSPPTSAAPSNTPAK